MPLSSDISAAANEIVAKMKNPLTDEQKLIVGRCLTRLEQLALQSVAATIDQVDLMKVEALGIKATLESISSAIATEALQLLGEKVASILLALTIKLV